MKKSIKPQRLAIIGGGPSALFLLRRFVDQKITDFEIEIFERGAQPGAGFPYSEAGASTEHITNVSGNEIPDLLDPLTVWIKSHRDQIRTGSDIAPDRLSDYNVVPRLLFGSYLQAQFYRYLDLANETGIKTIIHLQTTVTAVRDQAENGKMQVFLNSRDCREFDIVVVCTGHHWPVEREGRVKNHFDSPYPPAKLRSLVNVPVNIKGCSLTAIDAVRTLARANGTFQRDAFGKLRFDLKPDRAAFRINMRSRHAILPGLRFHLEDPHLSPASLLSRDDIARHRQQNDDFISLDFLFEKDFKEQFRKTDELFYDRIKDLTLEEFSAAALSSFADQDPFVVFGQEYADSLLSIQERKSEYWKEKLAILSVAMNYPAKYLSAEDTRRLHEHLMPLISIVIAFAPQHSAEEFLALHASGLLSLEPSDDETPDEATAFIDCTGQPHLGLKDFVFQDLVKSGSVTQARVLNRQKTMLVDVAGVAVTDSFRAVAESGKPHAALFIMAVPYIGGFNPDYSGLDFCEDAAKAVVDDLVAAGASG